MKILSKIKKVLYPMKRNKRIFIDNFGFMNRGDQLMIQSVLDQVRLHFPNSKVFLRREVFLENPTYCIDNRIYPLRMTNKLWPFFRVLNFLLRDDWFATPNQIDVVFDCCGYHITDVWLGDDSGNYYRKYYNGFSKQGRKIIFLPQAFGPFENPGCRETMQLVHDIASVIYARDKVSKEYIQSVCGENDKLKIAPDFTCLCNPSSHPVIQLEPKGYVTVIVNFNMVKHTNSEVSDIYMSLMIDMINHLLDIKEQVILCNHEGVRDEELLIELNKRIWHPVPVLNHLSGMDVKAIIRDTKLLITARYHGLVSALTQGTPALCTSWSHKYAEILAEFSCANSMLNVNDTDECLKKIDDALKCPNKYMSPIKYRNAIEHKVNAMWDDIFRQL